MIPDQISVRRLESITKKFKNIKIMVIGDIMIDEYMWGNVNRISPEAPVPVVEVEKITERLGGAANVVQNLSSLGIDPVLISVLGKQHTSQRMLSMLAEVNCSSDYLYMSPTRKTTIKTRIMAKQQQVVRADRETVKDLSSIELKNIINKFNIAIDDVQCVIISDYGKGVICTPFLKEIRNSCTKRNLFTAVDPKDRHFDRYKNVSIITPNLREAHMALGAPYTSHISDINMRDMGWKIVDKLNLSFLLLTLSERGMALFENKGRVFNHLPTVARNAFDVTGAGDTVISVFCAAFTSGASALEAAFIANHAAGITCGEIGTASVDIQTLIKACQ
jgi:D-beta-D-heptose 7-phosphate kinase/D-beta-D-heptose 1-phosphate adenosyltransferase